MCIITYTYFPWTINYMIDERKNELCRVVVTYSCFVFCTVTRAGNNRATLEQPDNKNYWHNILLLAISRRLRI